MVDRTPKEVVILATKVDINNLKNTVPLIQEHLNPRRINIVANESVKEEIDRIEGAYFVNENDVYPGLTFDVVKELIRSVGGPENRAGWYLQQFLKLGWSYKTSEQNYISIDSDTYILDDIKYINKEGKYLFTSKIERHEPYFKTIKTLFSGSVLFDTEYSFIAEQMVFDVKYVKEMIRRIEANCDLQGEKFYEKIIKCISVEDMIAGFSEFETYGNYMKTFHKDEFETRQLSTFRKCAEVLGPVWDADICKWVSNSFQIISMEKNLVLGKRVVFFHWLTNQRIIRSRVSFYDICKLYNKTIKLSDFLNHRKTLIYEEL